jgi:hypothetical protein
LLNGSLVFLADRGLDRLHRLLSWCLARECFCRLETTLLSLFVKLRLLHLFLGIFYSLSFKPLFLFFDALIYGLALACGEGTSLREGMRAPAWGCSRKSP